MKRKSLNEAQAKSEAMKRGGGTEPRSARGTEPRSRWYEEFFDDRYLDFYEGQVAVAPSDAEAAFIDRALSLAPGSRLLDLGCGFGRHSVALARLGHRVTGLDLSARLLEHAVGLAARSGVEVGFVRRDLRDLSGLGPFDACVCLYTVFGYFDDAENEGVLRSVREILAPGGLFVLDVVNPLSQMRSWPGERWRETRHGVTRETCRYEPLGGHIVSERTLYRTGGERVSLPESVVRMYTPSELRALLVRSGFDVEQLYGALGDQPFRWDHSEKQVFVARRRD